MIKKLIALTTAALLLACACGLAETVTFTDRDNDFRFEYDDSQFTIELEDYASDDDDADLVLILTPTDKAWGMADVMFMRLEEVFDQATRTELEEALELQLTQGEWNGINDVYTYTYEEDGVTEQAYIIQYDDDETLTISVTTDALEDAAIAQQRDDAISAILDSVKVLDD